MFDGMPQRSASGEDGFDALPDVILQHILGLLPAREAVRTCVLARRWRDQWKSTVSLLVTGDDFDDMDDLRFFMEDLLPSRGDAPLDTFELRLDDIVTDEFAYGDVVRVNRWFRHAIKCQARVLRLVNSLSGGLFELDHLPLVSRHLMELELAGVEVLKCALDLSGCPALEKLKMDNCDLSHAGNISSASLKCLSITGCEFSPRYPAQIYAPSLVSLQLHDNLWFNTPVLESTLSLVDASVRVGNKYVEDCGKCDSGNCDVCLGIMYSFSCCVRLEDLSHVKNLALMSESKAFISENDLKRCPTFTNLKTLLLSDYWCVTLNMDALTQILKQSPVLEKLTLELFSKGPYHKLEMKGSYSSIQRSAGISEHLKIVEVKVEELDARVLKVLKLLSTFNIYVFSSKVGKYVLPLESGSTLS